MPVRAVRFGSDEIDDLLQNLVLGSGLEIEDAELRIEEIQEVVDLHQLSCTNHEVK